MKIIVFSKYLSYMLGGAEKSTLEILKQESLNNKIQIISFYGVEGFGAKSKKTKFPNNWDISFIQRVKLFKRFPFWEYCINRKIVKKYFESIDSKDSVLYTYALYAPIAINSFGGDSKLFIRSETDLAINKNYLCGVKKYLKYIYILLEYPAFYIYKKDLKKAIYKANVVSNSKYMANKLKELYFKESDVLYPYIDEQRIKKEYLEVKYEIENKGIVFVGDAVIKGINIAKKIAKLMPEKEFYFFSRYYETSLKEDNITWMPWQNKEVDIYKYAKIVIVPSIWEEAYGRVSREAYILGLPVLVSNIGGLPETVDYRKKFIINDYKNIKNWVDIIESIY